MFLLVLGNGVVSGTLLKGSKAENSDWWVITVAWGLSVAFAIYAVGNISGAHINPAVTLGLAVVNEFPWEKVPGYMLSQVAGAFTGGALVWVFYRPHWKISEEEEKKLASFCTIPAIRAKWHNFMSETVATFVLVFGILFIGANEFTEGLNPLVIGSLITLIGLSLGGTTGFAINPARDLGPRIAHFLLPVYGKGSSDWQYSWVPIAGPLYGGMLGSLVYKWLYVSEVGVLLWPVAALFFVLLFLVIKNK